MGQEIVYCNNCKSRLTGKDFEKGKAFRIENNTVCLGCAKKILESLPPAERDAFAAQMKSQEAKKTSTTHMPAARPSETGSSSRVQRPGTGSSTRLRPIKDLPPEEEAAEAGPLSKRSKALVFGVGGGLVLVAAVLLVVVIFSGRRSSPPEVVEPPPPPRDAAPPPEDPRLKQARALLDDARAYRKASPEDYAGHLDRLERARGAAGGTALAEAADREIAEVKALRSQRISKEIADLDAQVKTCVDAGNFDEAARLLEAARSRFADPDWTAGIKNRVDDIERRRNVPPPDSPPPFPPAAEVYAVLNPDEAKSAAGAALKKLGDRSVLAPRAGPDQDSYTVTGRLDLKGITAFRVEALADASLPSRGPGRSDNGNFVLSEFRVEIDGRALAFKGASASWEQNGWPSSAAIDSDPMTGWAIQPRPGRDHEAVFHLQEPVDGGKFVFTLECLTAHPRHVLGRFRLSATTAKMPDPPPPRRTERSTPPVPPSVRAYRDRWKPAALLAVARDYDGAVRTFGEVQAGVTDPAFKAEAAADLADLKLAAALHAEVAAILSKWPGGQNLPAEILAGDGRRVRVDEPVRRAERLLFEVRPSADARALCAGEILASSLADLYLARGKPTDADRRAAGIFCALEGDADAARRHLGGNLPDKLEEHARLLPLANAAAEAEARRRLREAADGFFDPGTRASSLDRFAALLRDHKDAVVVRRSRASLEAGPEVLAEYVYAVTDLKAVGHFALQSLPRGEFAWVMGEDVADREKRREHAVEAAYSVPAGSEYRAWVLAGGCCQETFAFFVQANDLEVPGETTGIPVRCDPDSAVMAPVAHGLAGLKKTHAAHGGPKAPARFEWVALPVLKHAQGGAKRIRILSDQQGFAVAGLLVSSARKAAPKDDEWRAMEARRPRAWDLVDPQASSGSGWIYREVWRNIGGDDIDKLTGNKSFQGRATESPKATALEGPHNWADDYGTRMRGYLLPPNSGTYVFWICSDDAGELWLSSDDTPENKKKIAFLKGAVGFESWQDQPSQRSAGIRLVRGRRYYFEVLHKEGKDKDHIRVGWKIPDGPDERPIPGNRLAPYVPGQAGRLGVTITASPPAGTPPAVSIAVDVSGAAEVSRIEIFQGGRRLGEPKGSPLTYAWTRVPEGAYDLSARVTERSGRVSVSPAIGVAVGGIYFYRAVDLNGPSGSINRRAWAGRETGGYEATGTGHERLDVDLKPPTDPDHARMIRSSVFAKDGTKVALTNVPEGKYQVYLTAWEPRETPQGFEVLVNGKSADAEVKFASAGEWSRLGPWPAEPANGRIEVAAARGSGHFSGIELWTLGTPPKPTQRVKSEAIGGGGGSGFEETKDGDPFLVGFKLSKENRIRSIQGIWDGNVVGERHGGGGGSEVEVRAKPGYAVGGLRMRGGDRVYAFRVVFMKIAGPVLNPSDSYESEWLVGNEADTKLVGGDGYPVVGLHGGRGGEVDRLGIIQLK